MNRICIKSVDFSVLVPMSIFAPSFVVEKINMVA
jgi:hypothetical protein